MIHHSVLSARIQSFLEQKNEVLGASTLSQHPAARIQMFLIEYMCDATELVRYWYVCREER